MLLSVKKSNFVTTMGDGTSQIVTKSDKSQNPLQLACTYNKHVELLFLLLIRS